MGIYKADAPIEGLICQRGQVLARGRQSQAFQAAERHLRVEDQ